MTAQEKDYMVAWKPGGPRSRGAGRLCGFPDPGVKSGSVEIGVQLDPPGLENVCEWVVWDDGRVADDEL